MIFSEFPDSQKTHPVHPIRLKWPGLVFLGLENGFLTNFRRSDEVEVCPIFFDYPIKIPSGSTRRPQIPRGWVSRHVPQVPSPGKRKSNDFFHQPGFVDVVEYTRVAKRSWLHSKFFQCCIIFAIHIITRLSIQLSCWNERCHHSNRNLINSPAAKFLCFSINLFYFLHSFLARGEMRQNFQDELFC